MPRSSSCTRPRPPPGSGRRARRWSRSAATGAAPSVPRSDIDIVLVHDGAESAAVAALTRASCCIRSGTPASRVGHAVRTPGESVELATERLDAATAMLDARLLAGDAGLLRDASGPVLARLRGADPTGSPRAWRTTPATAGAVRLRRVPAWNRS